MNPAEDYILNQPEPFRNILLHLQSVIEHTIPQVELKFKYRIPFYYISGKPFCYLNVPPKKKYVDVGFWNAAHLTKHLEHLVTEKRKVMKSLRYTTLEGIDDTVLIAVLQEAFSVVDSGFWK
ncbi:DUF1801 domain-containing protein [Maribacter sp. 2304DJ31-5]|uniref:DUF1801 domain-containing protein n=1 Tax=Maribacter sp. 2304DJ31-5 TaxID=3386273 RepID=UPI0039BC3A4E